jgi:hypothetical protein
MDLKDVCHRTYLLSRNFCAINNATSLNSTTEPFKEIPFLSNQQEGIGDG